MVKMLLREFFIFLTISEIVAVINMLSFTNGNTEAQRDKVTSPELQFSEGKSQDQKLVSLTRTLILTLAMASYQWPGKAQHLDTPWALGCSILQNSKTCQCGLMKIMNYCGHFYSVQNLTDTHCLWSSQY